VDVRHIASGVENAKTGSPRITARDAMEARANQHSFASRQRAGNERVVRTKHEPSCVRQRGGRRSLQDIGFGTFRVDFDQFRRPARACYNFVERN
jgi:3-deoxy-D-arabino-heptulosonate 7-phosphate (DAHP) synthase